ncbi:hypothetical protein V3C99_012719 [Haemonchus contortus]|uniref:Copper transport protein n=1 Tax=Haemonchus contortus TaxID=6289 RepID=A0A7I4Y466_HAECO|nr:Ctr copper transporter domain containing protein [Haemonchus contortus]
MSHDHHHNHTMMADASPMIAPSQMDHTGAGAMHGSGHAMAFHFGSMETILFQFWKPVDAAGIVLSCVIIVVMCFLMETIRFLRSYRNTGKPVVHSRLRLEPTISPSILVDALLNLVQITLSYSLMLIFMTFNVWLCLSVVIGEVLSHLLYSILFPYFEMGTAGSC